MKLDWSDPSGDQTGREIYECIRNLWLVKLLMRKIIDNNKGAIKAESREGEGSRFIFILPSVN